jgi:mannosyl-3-phosphoglycerate phosphatase
MTHRDIRPRIEQIRLQTGLNSPPLTTWMNVISEWTGLTRYRAALARKHDASVTLIWRDTDDAMVRFEEALAQRGLKCLQGARFWHILDALR